MIPGRTPHVRRGQRAGGGLPLAGPFRTSPGACASRPKSRESPGWARPWAIFWDRGRFLNPRATRRAPARDDQRRQVPGGREPRSADRHRGWRRDRPVRLCPVRGMPHRVRALHRSHPSRQGMSLNGGPRGAGVTWSGTTAGGPPRPRLCSPRRNGSTRKRPTMARKSGSYAFRSDGSSPRMTGGGHGPHHGVPTAESMTFRPSVPATSDRARPARGRTRLGTRQYRAKRCRSGGNSARALNRCRIRESGLFHDPKLVHRQCGTGDGGSFQPTADQIKGTSCTVLCAVIACP